MQLTNTVLTLFSVLLFSSFSFSQSDDPCGAPALTVSGSCSFATYTNAGATDTPGVPAPGCASYSGQDVWFTVTVPASGNVTIDTDVGGITDSGMAAYSGTCASLTLVDCDDDGSSNGLFMSMLELTGQTPGATLWIRVWEWGGGTGTFDICAFEPVVAAPPANDDCSGAFPTTVNAGTCTSVTSGTVDGATASSQSATACNGTEDDDVWFSFVAPATGSVDVDLLNIAGSTTDLYHSIWEGTCPSLTLVAGTCSDPNSQTVTGLTPGNTYYVRVYSWTGTPGQTTTFDLCLTDNTPPPAPANDDPCAATPLTVNASCSFATYTNEGATASAGVPAPGCASYSGSDVWFTVTVPASGDVTVDMNTGVMTDAGMAIYSGTCASLTFIECDDDDSPNGLMSMIELTGQAPGATLWVRVWEFGNDNNGTFDICAYEPVVAPPPPNDDCTGAYPLTVNTSGCTSVTAGTVNGATASSQDATACGGTENDDVWFSFVAPATGSVDISILNVAGSTTDMYHSLWEGTCPALTLVSGSCSDANTSAAGVLTPGNTYYIRVNTWSSTSGATSTFDVCVEEAPVCGIGLQTTNDYCEAPAILTQGPGSWSSSTYSYYTSDTPVNTDDVFCGSIENNSWYQFTALSTTETFNFSSVTNCTLGDGVQAEVYEVSTSPLGCCSNLSSVSNCWNPATPTSGTVTATGLTIGNDYILMVDGWGGDNCEFTVTGWTATGILPVELVYFNAIASTNHNMVTWQTESEFNNDFFRVMRSIDGENFEEIATVKGKGNSSIAQSYQFNDMDVRNGEVYYRLEQVDFDGTTTLSEIISLSRKPMKEGLLTVYPNPANDMITVELFDESFTDATLNIVSMSGQVIYSEALIINGLIKKQIQISEIPQGVYNIVVHHSNKQEMTRLIVE